MWEVNTFTNGLHIENTFETLTEVFKWVSDIKATNFTVQYIITKKDL